MKRPTEKSIRIRQVTHDRLKQRGTVGDTMDSVITKLLDIAEGQGK